MSHYLKLSPGLEVDEVPSDHSGVGDVPDRSVLHVQSLGGPAVLDEGHLLGPDREPAPVPLWRRPGDPRGPITNRHLLQMSAGLKFVGNQEPGGSPQNTVLDHYYIYTGGIDAFNFSINEPQ